MFQRLALQVFFLIFVYTTRGAHGSRDNADLSAVDLDSKHRDDKEDNQTRSAEALARSFNAKAETFSILTDAGMTPEADFNGTVCDCEAEEESEDDLPHAGADVFGIEVLSSGVSQNKVNRTVSDWCSVFCRIKKISGHNEEGPWQWEMSKPVSVVLATVLTMALLRCFIYSVKAMMSDTSTLMFRIRCSNTWLSCLQLVVMTLPLVNPVWRNEYLPSKIRRHWMVIAFWNAFSNADCYGTFVMYAFHMWYGCFLACMSMVIWNYVVPGGYGCIKTPIIDGRRCVENTTWLLGERTGRYCTIGFAALCVYLVLLSRIWIDSKRICLLYMATLFSNHLNPKGDWTDFSPFLIGWDLGIHWANGGVWIPLIVFLGFSIRCPMQYWLPMETITGGRISYLCSRKIDEELSHVVHEYVRGFSLMLNWATPESTHHADNVRKVLERGDTWLKSLENLISEAWWEIHAVRDYRRMMCHFQWFLAVMGDIKKMNQFLLLTAEEALGGEIDSQEKLIHSTIAHYIKGFVDIYSSILCVLIDREKDAQMREATVMEGLELAASLQDAIMQEIRTLVLDKVINGDKARDSLLFFHAAGMWMTAIKGALSRYDSTRMEAWRVLPHCRTYLGSTIFLKSQHIFAVTITLAWCVAFLFSAFYCNYRATAATTLSLMIIDKTHFLLDILDRLRVRIVGVALGVVMANDPAFIFCLRYTEFRNWPYDLVSYYVIFLFFWGLLMYGTLIGGSSAYTFQTWAGFGSVELLRPLMLLNAKNDPPQVDEIKVGSFNSIIHASSGMLFLGVALVIMVLYRGFFSADKLSQHLVRTLEAAKSLVESIRLGVQHTEQVEGNLRQALSELEDVVVASKQSAALTSSDFSDEVIQLVLTQCEMTSAIAESLHMLQGDLDVNLAEVMSKNLSSCAYFGDLDEFVNAIVEEHIVHRPAQTHDAEKSIELSSMPHFKRRSANSLAYVMSPANKHEEWSALIEGAILTKQLKELAATWSFEFSARLVNESLSKIQVFRQNYDQNQQSAVAQGTAKFHDVCKDIRRLVHSAGAKRP